MLVRVVRLAALVVQARVPVVPVQVRQARGRVLQALVRAQLLPVLLPLV